MKKEIPIHVALGFMISVLLVLIGSLPVSAEEDCEDRIVGWAIRDTVFIAHNGAYYNCCGIVSAGMDLPEPGVVDVIESERFLPYGPCRCMCCFGISIWGNGFAPGTYTVRVWNESHSVLYGETEVVVHGPRLSQPELLAVERTRCGETTPERTGDGSEEPGSPDTWGCIKNLYR